MTNKEIAEMTHSDIAQVLSDLLDGENAIQNIREFIDDLDPPKPEPGTVVWWRLKKSNDRRWRIGKLDYNGTDEIVCFAERCVPYQELSDIEWKPARILDPDQVAVRVPPVSEWPEQSGQILAMYCTVTSARVAPLTQIITRAEAEKMQTFYDFDKEAEDE